MKTKEELKITGTDATPDMTSTEPVIGKSGAKYYPVNFFTDLSGPHMDLAITLLTPAIEVMSDTLAALRDAGLSKETAGQLVLTLAPAIKQMLRPGLDRRCLALLFVEKDHPRYANGALKLDPDDEESMKMMSARVEDFGVMSLGEKLEAFKRFFSGAGASALSIFGFSSESGMMLTK